MTMRTDTETVQRPAGERAVAQNLSAALPVQLPSRVVIESVQPEVDGGRFPIKRTVAEEVVVTADIHADGHDVLAAVLRYRAADDAEWQEVSMEEEGNDRWAGRFTVSRMGRYEYTVQAWVDRFASWRKDLSKKVEAGQDVASDLLEGAEFIRQTGRRTRGADADWLRERAEAIAQPGAPRTEQALDPRLGSMMAQYADRAGSTSYRTLGVVVEHERARYGAWYELFPRSCSPEPGRHGTFRDLEARLPYVAAMGFDVLYLPPIHPIGRSFRKGPNNSLVCGPNDPGSPWGIGSAEGGHTAVHSELGTLDDFDRLVAAAARHSLEVALDIAWQCSPDHPYVREHPEWFRHRPDGTIKYAENPPKKYQDIYPLNFECDDWQGLWQELKDVILFWIGHGVHIFRVDNPHTKPFRFWTWLIREVQEQHPDTVFLSEAFTRPKVMRYLAKCGFSQSYTYFTWRNTKWELTEYLTELTQTEVREYMRPNLFANTPDILHEYLQHGGRAAFQVRLVLAATLAASYGIYGPPFELCESRAVRQGSEEYLDSEKFQLCQWDLDRSGNIRDFITRINQIRRENPALHRNWNLRFYPIDNDQLLCYGKTTPDNIILVAVNLDPHHTQAGFVQVPLADLGAGPGETYQLHDLISDARYLWHGERNFIRLAPQVCPAHVFRVRRRLKTERDFDYFM
jgi:starch synthase (maltosyl-transferring)